MMVMNGEEGLEREVHIDGIHLEHVLELKYLVCVLSEAGTDGAVCSRKGASGRRVAGAIRTIVNARDLQIESCMKHCLYILTYGNETMLWKEKERSRIRAVQMDKLRGLLGIRKMNRVPNAWIKRVVQSNEGSR